MSAGFIFPLKIFPAMNKASGPLKRTTAMAAGSWAVAMAAMVVFFP
jgi:hypothetical protein